jgi:hypothetical protein
MWVQLASHIQLIPLSCRCGGPLATGIERPGSLLKNEPRLVTSDWKQPSRASLLRRTFVVHPGSTSPSARHIYFLYIFNLCLRWRILPFRLRITGMDGMVGPPPFYDPSRSVVFLSYSSSFLHFWLTLVIGKNVDDVSEGISNLGITTATQNSQPIPLTVEAHPPTSPATTTTFLSLPWLVKWHIYTHLHSKDCIALSSTCRQMYDLNTFAYTHLQFLPPNSLFSLARSVHRLAAVLACSPHYARAVRTLWIVGWNSISVPDGHDSRPVYDALDESIAAILKNASHIYSLTLDFNLTKRMHCFSQTFATLTRVRTIRNLRLATFLIPTSMAENSSPQERTPDQAPPAYERASLRVYSGGRLPVMIQDLRDLRWFGYAELGDSWDTLQCVAEAGTELETLVLGNGLHFDANMLGQMLQSGFVRVCISEAVFSVPVTDHNGINDHMMLGTWGPRKVEVIFGKYDHPLLIEPEATFLWLLTFFGYALENRHQHLWNMASRHWPSVYP